MVVDPGSHRGGVVDHKVPLNVPEELSGNLYSCVDSALTSMSSMVAIKMEPGDGLLFHGDLIHGTPPNRTSLRRRALQLHYSAAHCQPSIGGIPSKNVAPDDDGKGFDCSPLGEKCVNPQYWVRRKARIDCMRKSGKRTWLCLNGTIEAM